MDALDRRLLRCLLEDGRRSFRELARLTGTTPPTAAARVRRLEDLGVILGYSVRIDPEVFGKEGNAAAVDRDAPTAVDMDIPAAIDLDTPAAVRCHWCGSSTTDPRIARIGGRDHPFCCPTCEKAYLERHARLSEGL